MEERGWFNRGEKRMTAGEEEAGDTGRSDASSL